MVAGGRGNRAAKSRRPTPGTATPSICHSGEYALCSKNRRAPVRGCAHRDLCRAILLACDPGEAPTSRSYLLMRRSAQWLTFVTRAKPVSEGPLAYSTVRAGLARQGFPIPFSPRPGPGDLSGCAATLRRYPYSVVSVSPWGCFFFRFCGLGLGLIFGMMGTQTRLFPFR